ncbi:unnamed protein product [Cyprideis torosa]|uniref:Uncharacterized protein n=1 Tax=Cyprideis torosa TaxID=163714 RepID=A0A7R8WHN2_9CRUS|nr:unnamed protein product [Cyprideis torosa]CAG0896836.1 unnamed protein product [Cyprideis torosa]
MVAAGPLPLPLLVTVFALFQTVTSEQHHGGADIWVFMTIGYSSHNNFFRPLVLELAERGHRVTFFTTVRSNKHGAGNRTSTPMGGYVQEIVFEEGAKLTAIMGKDQWSWKGNILRRDQTSAKERFVNVTRDACESLFQWEEFLPYFQGHKGRPDLVINTMFFQECVLIVPHKFQVPFIMISPHGLFVGPYSDAIGLRPFYSTVQHPILSFPSNMTFLQRVGNLLALLSLESFSRSLMSDFVDGFLTQHNQGESLTLIEILRECSLYILNWDIATEPPIASIAPVIHAGGLHCRPAKPIPKNLQDWIEKGQKGFIYFSLGSAAKGIFMGEEERRMFVEAFKQFPDYRIFWKWETEKMEDLPPHVFLSKWFPQQDLLGHDDIRLFITHGGLLSTQEATYHGVPVVGIGIGVDQMANMQNTERKGAGIALEWASLSTEGIVEAMNRILRDPSFRENVARRSVLMKDQPEGPLEKAAFWVEFVIRHGGAKHLRSAARDLNWWQYHSFDVWGFLITCFCTVALLNFWFFRWCLRSLLSRRWKGNSRLARQKLKKT